MPVENCSIRPSLQLSRHRPVRRLTDSCDALLETGKRSRRKVAVILNRVPAVFDTADVGFVFTDVIRDGHCGARTCIASPFDETAPSHRPFSGPSTMFGCPGVHGTRSRTQLYLECYCADRRHQGCQYGGPGTSVRRRFSSSSRTSRCLPVSNYLGYRNVKHNGGSRH